MKKLLCSFVEFNHVSSMCGSLMVSVGVFLCLRYPGVAVHASLCVFDGKRVAWLWFCVPIIRNSSLIDFSRAFLWKTFYVRSGIIFLTLKKYQSFWLMPCSAILWFLNDPKTLALSYPDPVAVRKMEGTVVQFGEFFRGTY